MRQTKTRNISPFSFPIFIALSILIGLSPLYPLDLSLNNRSLSVLDNTALTSWSQDSAIPLESLYPWLESINSLEVQSGSSRVYWDELENWNKVQLVFHNGIWEVHAGRDIFSNPDRINVSGTRREITSISIWSAIDNPDLKDDLLSALAFRDVRVDWKDISRPEHLLTDPPGGELPELLLLDQFQLLRLNTLIDSPRPVAGMKSQWLTAEPGKQPLSLPLPLAMDAYQGEAALLFLLGENPRLFDAHGRLPENLPNLLNLAAAARKTNLILTDLPLTSLSAGAASSAVRLPSSTESCNAEELHPVDPPEYAVNIVSLQYAGIPASLSPRKKETAGLILNALTRISPAPDESQGVPIPSDPRILRFYDAYERIGRLAISGTMDSREAVELMNQYINEEGNPGKR